MYIIHQMYKNKRLMKIYIGTIGFVAAVLIILIYSVDFKAILNKAEEEVKIKVEEVKEKVEVKVEKAKNKVDKLGDEIEKKIKEVEARLKEKLKGFNAK